MASLSSLPTEIVHQICTLLPLPSLLAFGTTCRLHSALSRTTLRSLKLGIFPTKIQGIASILAAGNPESTKPLNVVLPRGQSRSKECVIRNQNRKAAKILSRHGRALRELELSIWSLEQQAAEQIAKITRLQHLGIRLDHARTRHRDIRPGYWREAERSTVWNTFFADTKERESAEQPGASDDASREDRRQISSSKPVFGELETITLERAGITDWQLQQLLEENPKVRELHLRKCTELTDEFFAWLADSRLKETLRVLHFENCEGLSIDVRILSHLGALGGLEDLSLSACPHVPNDELKELAKSSWPGLKSLVLPQVFSVELPHLVEVDPAYK